MSYNSVKYECPGGVSSVPQECHLSVLSESVAEERHVRLPSERQERQVRVSDTNIMQERLILQDCQAKASFESVNKSVLPERQVKVSCKSVKSECPRRVSRQSVLQECLTRVSYKTVEEECQVRVSCKSVK